jgi:DNA-binding NarL/FixJ family response regulator
LIVATEAIESGVPPYALVIDDHPLVARGFAEYLVSHCGFVHAHIATSAVDCWRRIETEGCPGVAVVDFWLPDGAALLLIRQLATQCVQTRLLVVSGDEDKAIESKAREAGAHGFLHKQESPDVFALAIAALRTGGAWFGPLGDAALRPIAQRELPIRARDLGLTDRQGQVLGMMLRGLPNKRIAIDLAISEQTVKEHMTNILAKLGVGNRMEAITLLRGRRIEA